MIYGYVRVSTKRQNLERQIKNILAYCPDAKIYSDKYTGMAMDRPEWLKLCKRVLSGDTIIFDSVSRMSRSAEDGTALYEALFEKGVNLVFLKEPHINTDTYKNTLNKVLPNTGGSVDCIIKGINEYLMLLAREQIRLAFEQAEKEAHDTRVRTRESLQIAKAKGTQIGNAAVHTNNHEKKASACKAIMREHSHTFGGSLSDIDCLKLCGCSRNSYFKYKKQLIEELASAAADQEQQMIDAVME